MMWHSRTRSSPSPGRPAASGRSCAAYFGGQGAAIVALDRSDTVTAFAERLRRDGIPNRVRRRRHRRRGRHHVSVRENHRARWPSRHPHQQRRRVTQSEPRAHHARGLQRRRRRQSERGVQLRLRRSAGHEGAAGWRDRQHRLGERAHRARRRRLQRRQGGLDQPDEGDRAGIRPLQHPREYRLPRHASERRSGTIGAAAIRKCSHSSSAGIRSAASSSRSRSCARSPSSPPTPHRPSPVRCCPSTADSRPVTSSWRAS